MIFDKEQSYYFQNYEETPLHLASKFGHIETVEYLIEKGADVNARSDI